MGRLSSLLVAPSRAEAYECTGIDTLYMLLILDDELLLLAVRF